MLWKASDRSMLFRISGSSGQKTVGVFLFHGSTALVDLGLVVQVT